MKKTASVIALIAVCSCLMPFTAVADDIDDILLALKRGMSGNRARDYTMRLWRYDKWSTLPMWQNTAREAQAVMRERGFDEAVIVDTPADGVTTFGTWTNPIGWDCRQATLEVIEPRNIPDEFRFLCNYLDNPTSLNNYSCPTPPGGVVAELALLEQSSGDALDRLDADGKIILVSGGSRGMKRHLDRNGVLGIVSDEIESANADFINANQWLNGWSDMPGGWQMNASDSRNHFGFSISQKKGAFLRRLLRDGVTVKVRATIDSRYFTDSHLPYVIGSIRGTDPSGEDVLVASHIYEWGANDDCAGASVDLEALGTLRDLIESGVLPRPKRTIRMWLGFECYGSMAYTVHNIERMRTKTLAVVCCDSPAENYDLATTTLQISSNFNACPSFTDAVFPEVVGRYYNTYAPSKLWVQRGFMGGLDNFFGDPMIGVPINAMYMANGSHHHHNSMDTIDRVDPRTLEEQSVLQAAYMYFLADADESDVPFIAGLAFDRGITVITGKAADARADILAAKDGEAIGKALYLGKRSVEYYTGLQRRAVESTARVVPPARREAVVAGLKPHTDRLDAFGKLMSGQLDAVASQRAADVSVKVAAYRSPEGPWEKEAATIVPKRKHIGTMTLEQVPVDRWEEVSGSPRWWGETNWASSSYFWCDGKRNLVEIRDLVEIEAGRPITNFDLIKYYRFLERNGMVEFVR